MPGSSTEQLSREIAELDQQIAELESDGSGREMLDASRDDLGEIRDFIDNSQSDIDAAKDEIEETVGELKDMSSQLEDLLETEEVKEFVDGVSGGLESTSNILGKTKEKLDQLDDLLERAQLADDLTAEQAQAQLEAFANAFEKIVSDLGPLIDMVPGLGAFLQIYGMAIRNIAQSAGVMEEIVGRNNDLYQELRPGQHLYITSETIRADQLRSLKYERSQLMDEAMEAAREERLGGDDTEAGPHQSEVDRVVQAARNRSGDALPTLDSEAYLAWVGASKALDEAEQARGAAQTDLAGYRWELAESEIALETARNPGQRDDAEARVQSAQGSVERGQERLDKANAEYDEAAANYDEAYRGHRAEIDAYDEAVRDWVIRLEPYANEGKGFDEGDWETLRRDYPQYAPGQTPASDAGTGKKRLVLIGGGGILAGLMVIGGFFLLGDQTASEDGPTPTASAGSGDALGEGESPADASGEADVCAESALGCVDVGTLPGATTVEYRWQETSCAETPAATSASTELTPSSLGARLTVSDGGPRASFLIGDGTVVGSGGFGGTVTRDGVTTTTQTFVEVLDVGEGGFTATVERLTGPADDEGDLDMATAECELGGQLTVGLDPVVFADWMALPTATEPPMQATGFACITELTADGARVSWAVSLESAVPMPAAPLEATLFARLSDWVTVTSTINNTTMPPGFLILDADGSEPPEALQQTYQSDGLWGNYRFSPANGPEEAEALDGFGVDSLVDAQIRITSGVFSAFPPSTVCPHQ